MTLEAIYDKFTRLNEFKTCFAKFNRSEDVIPLDGARISLTTILLGGCLSIKHIELRGGWSILGSGIMCDAGLPGSAEQKMSNSV